MPPFTEEHEELRESIRRFVLKELRPHVQEWEDDEWFPNEVFHKMAAVGFLGLKYPEEYGGEGGDYLDRKSTRLNSSHGYSSYAVFCLKKKYEDIRQPTRQLSLS